MKLLALYGRIFDQMAENARTIVLLTPLVGNILPRMVTGIQRVANDRNWNLFTVVCHRNDNGFLTFERSPGGGTLDELFSLLSPSGAIVALDAVKSSEMLAAVRSAGISSRFPVVHLGEPQKSVGAVYAHGDAKSFAEMALRELLLSGFDDFAYAPFEHDLPWNRVRGESFARLVALAGKRFHAFPFAAKTTSGQQQGKLTQNRRNDILSQTDRFVEWIAALPKPCGIFAANDTAGESVLLACERLGLDVPGRIAVVGVDDIDYICNHTRPTLSSIRRDLEGEGRAASELLAWLLAHPGSRPKPRAVPAIALVRRSSTRFSRMRDKRVADAEEWIRLHACEEGVGPRDVVRQMGVSRTTADRLFRAVAHRTMLDEIRSVRIERAQEKIRAGVPYDLAAAECGFSSTLDFRRTFRQLVGMPVVKWTKTI